jgi:hypothetical protein
MFPIYKSTFERGDGLNNVWPNSTSSYRDHVIAWSKDLGRSIDYLDSRADIDHNRLAYEGYNWGASMGSIFQRSSIVSKLWCSFHQDFTCKGGCQKRIKSILLPE